MKVYIKNKLLSLGGSSTVVDENNNSVYKVKGKVFSLRKKKFITDMNGNRLYTVRNKLINILVHSTYIIDSNGNKVARVKDKVFNFNNEYVVEGFKDEISVQGKFFSLTSSILRNGKVIGTINRKIDFFVDSFELEGEPEDMPFLIALVISIDNIVDRVREQK